MGKRDAGGYGLMVLPLCVLALNLPSQGRVGVVKVALYSIVIVVGVVGIWRFFRQLLRDDPDFNGETERRFRESRHARRADPPSRDPE